MKKKQFYRIKVICTNCGKVAQRLFRVRDKIDRYECSRCGCTTLKSFELPEMEKYKKRAIMPSSIPLKTDQNLFYVDKDGITFKNVKSFFKFIKKNFRK